MITGKELHEHLARAEKLVYADGRAMRPWDELSDLQRRWKDAAAFSITSDLRRHVPVAAAMQSVERASQPEVARHTRAVTRDDYHTGDISDKCRAVPSEETAQTATDVALDKASKTVEKFPAWMKRPEVSGKPAKRDWKVGDKVRATRSDSNPDILCLSGKIVESDIKPPFVCVLGIWVDRSTLEVFDRGAYKYVHTKDLCDPEPGATASEPLVTTNPVKAIAERTVPTFRDRLIIATMGGVWTNQRIVAAGNGNINYRHLLGEVDELIAEMATVRP